jgi:hypothetical protein
VSSSRDQQPQTGSSPRPEVLDYRKSTVSDLAALTEATGQTPDFWLRSEIGKHKSLRAPFVFVLRSP